MRIFSAFLVLLTLALFVHAQDKTDKAESDKAALPINERMSLSEDKLLKAGDEDKAEAKKLGFKVFRILPRETYDGKISMRGGGAYYSFVPRYDRDLPTGPNGMDNHTADVRVPLSPHYYGYGSDLELYNGKFTVGFAGADYGFLYDLGDRSLDAVTKEIPEAVFLTSYQPPTKMVEIRAEQTKIFHNPFYEANGFKYKRTVPAVVGHSYILRSINFRESDVMVALKVHRQDSDGSLIVFWKKLETFETPYIDRE